ncbi:MAG: acyl carrier protein [Candidatus Omnitrophota bacterium]|jgi:acyl carrier protein
MTEEIKKIQEIMREIAGKEFNENEPLLMTHCIDSMDVVEIATAMERKFNIKIKGEEISFDNFDTIAKMGDFVSRKVSERALV